MTYVDVLNDIATAGARSLAQPPVGSPAPIRPMTGALPAPAVSPTIPAAAPAMPGYSNLDLLIEARNAARARAAAALGAPEAIAERVKPVRPAFRTKDLLAGGLPALILMLAGKGDAAAQYAGGYLGGKQNKAAEDTAMAQSDADRKAQLQNAASRRELGMANFDLQTASQDLADYQTNEVKGLKERAAARSKALSLAMPLYRMALDRNQEPAFRQNAADQMAALLSEFIDDPAVGQMLGSIEAIRPELGRPSTANSLAEVKLQRERKALANMDQDLKDRHLNYTSMIESRRAMLAFALQSRDLSWFKGYMDLFDSAIKDVDEQLKRWQDHSKEIGGLSQEEFDLKVRPLIDYKNQLVADKNAVPMPERPANAGDPNLPDLDIGSLAKPAGNEGMGDGQGGVVLPIPKGGVGAGFKMPSAPIVKPGDVAKKQAAEDKKKTKDSEAKAKADERTATEKEIKKAIRDLEVELAGLDPKEDAGDIKKIQAEIKARKKQLGDLEPVKGGGGMANQGMAAFELANRAGKAGKDEIKKLRAEVAAALKKHKDPRQIKAIKAEFKRLTGENY